MIATAPGPFRCPAFAVLAFVLVALAAVPGRAADHVKAGVVRSMGGSPNFIAVEKGFFKDEGLDVEILYFDSAQPIAVAVASGDADFGTTGLTAAFFNLAGAGTLKVVASGTWERPGFQSIGFLVSNQAYAAGVTSLKDIGGHTAGITQNGSPLPYNLALAAKKYGVDFSTIRILALQSNSNVGTALAGGQVDVAVQTVAPAYSVIDKGGARLLGWAGDELPPDQNEAVFTSAKMIDERGDVAKRYLRAYRKAMAYFHDAFADANDKRRDGPHAEEVIDIAAKYLQQSPEQIRKGIPFFDPQGRIVRKNFVDLVAWYKAQGMLKTEVDMSALIDKRVALEVSAP